jgi:hypothetical protein
MGKKQAEQSRKRQQARAERRRVDAKRRKAEARASAASTPKTGVPEATREFSAIRVGLEELLAGGGEVAATVRTWSPGEGDKPAQITLDVRLLGLTATMYGTFHQMHPEDFFGEDFARMSAEEIEEHEEGWSWESAAPARFVLGKVMQDKSLAAAVTLHSEIGRLVDELKCDRVMLGHLAGDREKTVAHKIYARLGLADDLVDLLAPIAKQLPSQEKSFWFSMKRVNRWPEAVWQYFDEYFERDSTGPLVETVRSLDAAALARLPARPSWPAPHVPRVTRPSADVIKKFLAALNELMSGGGSVSAELKSWSPGVPQGKAAEAVLELRLFGLDATVSGKITPLTPAEFFGADLVHFSAADIEADEEWQETATARLVLDQLVTDKDLAVKAILSHAVTILVDDYLGLGVHVTEKVCEALGVPLDIEPILDPIAQRLPEDAKAEWYEDGREEDDRVEDSQPGRSEKHYVPGHISECLWDAIEIDPDIAPGSSYLDFTEGLDFRLRDRLRALVPPKDASRQL